MKKFGTPIRAAPGSASENVGACSVGEPSALTSGLPADGGLPRSCSTAVSRSWPTAAAGAVVAVWRLVACGLLRADGPGGAGVAPGALGGIGVAVGGGACGEGDACTLSPGVAAGA